MDIFRTKRICEDRNVKNSNFGEEILKRRKKERKQVGSSLKNLRLIFYEKRRLKETRQIFWFKFKVQEKKKLEKYSLIRNHCLIGCLLQPFLLNLCLKKKDLIGRNEIDRSHFICSANTHACMLCVLRQLPPALLEL